MTDTEKTKVVDVSSNNRPLDDSKPSDPSGSGHSSDTSKGAHESNEQKTEKPPNGTTKKRGRTPAQVAYAQRKSAEAKKFKAEVLAYMADKAKTNTPSTPQPTSTPSNSVVEPEQSEPAGGGGGGDGGNSASDAAVTDETNLQLEKSTNPDVVDDDSEPIAPPRKIARRAASLYRDFLERTTPVEPHPRVINQQYVFGFAPGTTVLDRYNHVLTRGRNLEQERRRINSSLPRWGGNF